MKEKAELAAGLKRRIISVLLAGMSTHKDETTMMRNGCLVLSQFRIPQDVVCVPKTLHPTFNNIPSIEFLFRCVIMKHW